MYKLYEEDYREEKDISNFTIISNCAFVVSSVGVCVGTTSGFSDMPSNWSTKALENAVNNGLLVGDNGKIMPNDNLTRAQMATVVNRAFGTTKKVSLSSYTDVAANAWYYDEGERNYENHKNHCNAY
ncbi:MAG TPA: S-layer homology domain-containing protein [Anaerovoracaceae bacterium]|nr:S-layer homology domain-containing protein [Anaerovoracaceae bacterium]